MDQPNQLPGNQQPQQQIDLDLILAASCYGIFPAIALAMSILMMILRKDDMFIQFHAKQGLVLGIIGIVLMAAPYYIGTSIALVLFPILAIYAIIKTLQREQWKIPIIHDLVEQFKL